MTQRFETTKHFKTSLLTNHHLNAPRLSGPMLIFLKTLVHQGLFTIPGCLHSLPRLPKGYHPPCQAACRWCLLWTCRRPCCPWHPKLRSPPYRDHVDCKESTLGCCYITVDSATTALQNGACTYRCISKQMRYKTPLSHNGDLKSLEIYENFITLSFLEKANFFTILY